MIGTVQRMDIYYINFFQVGYCYPNFTDKRTEI